MGPVRGAGACRRPSCAPSSTACPSPRRWRRRGARLAAPDGARAGGLPDAEGAGGAEALDPGGLRRGAGGDRPRPGRGGGELAARIVTTSPDVTVSTNLGPWVNRRGIFDRHLKNDVFRDAKLASAQRWGMSPEGQHIELGIAEQNLFLLLSRAGPGASLYGARLLPIGTVYDPFVNRGLDALIYACYQDARFLLVSDAFRADPRAGRRPAPVDQHAAARHGPGPAGELRAGACRTNWRS